MNFSSLLVVSYIDQYYFMSIYEPIKNEMLANMNLPVNNEVPIKKSMFIYVLRAIEFLYETVYFHFLPYLVIIW
jgi:hypothetical protein